MIRPATLLDVPQLVVLGERMHAESRFSAMGYAPDKVAALLTGLISSPVGCVLVAERQGAVVGGMAGYCDAHFFSNDLFAADLAVFVEPDRRGGIAAARLVRAFVDWATRRGARMIQVGISTGVHVEQTTRLYESLGFARVGPLMEWRG